MTYEYSCYGCNNSFDVIKSVSQIENPEKCPKCGTIGDRVKFPRTTYLNGTKVTNAEYNPAFGCVVKNKHHERDLCKKHDMVQIGNDFGSGGKMQKVNENNLREKLEKSWDE